MKHSKNVSLLSMYLCLIWVSLFYNHFQKLYVCSHTCGFIQTLQKDHSSPRNVLCVAVPWASADWAWDRIKPKAGAGLWNPTFHTEAKLDYEQKIGRTTHAAIWPSEMQSFNWPAG